jgi:hypothetical protein
MNFRPKGAECEKNAAGTNETINEVASAEQIEAVKAEVSRNANTILNHATANNKPIEAKQRTYEQLQAGLQAEAEKSRTNNKPSYESNIDLSSSDANVKQRNEEIKQAWANLEANRKMMADYRESLTRDKDELADITAQEAEVDKQLAEIQKLQENLRQSVGSTVTLTNGAKLTNDGVEENGKGIRQLSSEELKAKGINDPEKLLGKDNAFIEYESKDQDGNAITKQHLVNSKLEDGKRVTNITTDAQDLNADGVINKEELPSNDNKPLEQIITSLANNTNPNLYLSSVQFNGDKAVIPPSAQNRIGDKYSDVYGSIPEGQFKTLKLSKGETGMVMESLEGTEFWKQYTAENNLNNIINNKTATGTVSQAAKPNALSTTIADINLSLDGKCIQGVKVNNPDFSDFVLDPSSGPKEFYRFTVNQQELEKLTKISADDMSGLGTDARWLNDAYSDQTLTSESKEQQKSFGNYDLITKKRDAKGNFTYELNLSAEAYDRFKNRLS